MALFHAQHTLTQGSLHYRLATLGYQKRNTYGVEIFILYHDSHFFHVKIYGGLRRKNATPTALIRSFYNIIDANMQIN